MYKNISNIISVILITVLLMTPAVSFAQVPSSTSEYTSTYEVEGGVIYFNEKTGAIVGCDDSVTKAVIPESINGVTVTKIKDYAFKSCANLESIVIADTVTELGYSAFSDSVKLKEAVLPEGLTEIEYYLFSGCTALESVYIPDSVLTLGTGAFQNCISLKDLELPSSLQSINYDVFSNCDAMTAITIPKSVVVMSSTGSGIFSNCDSLTDIYFEDGMTEIPAYACKGINARVTVHFPESVTKLNSLVFNKAGFETYEIPETITEIGYGVFSGSALKSIKVPSTVTSIGSYAFAGCKSLGSAVIESGITEIPSEIFSECINLETLELPEGITSIGDKAFYNCSKITDFEWSAGLVKIGESAFYGTMLTEADFPHKLTTIGYDAFDSCKELEKVVIPETLSNAESAFSNCPKLETYVFEGNRTSLPKGFFTGAEIDFKLELPSGMTVLSEGLFSSAKFNEGYELVLPETIQKISSNCFRNSTLDSFTLPSELTTIESYAFDGCKSLKNITFNDKVTIIGMYAFRNADSLTKIEFPDSLTVLDSFAFTECDALTDVHIPANMTKVNGAFSDCTSLAPERITFDSSMDTLPQGMFEHMDSFEGTYNIPEHIKYVGEEAFRFSNIKSVNMHDGVKELRESAFANCSDLEDLKIGNGLTLIGDFCFEYCNGIKELSLIMDEGIIGYKAFTTCQYMEFVELYGVKEIGERAFSSCHHLIEMIIGDGTETIGRECFNSTANLADIRIPGTVTFIDGTFNDWNDTFDPVIHAPAGSYAESYAEEQGYFFIDNSIAKDTVITLPKNIYYTGKALKPKVTITLTDGTLLEENVDYSVKYSNNTAIGYGTVTIKGMGFFSGEAVKKFEIKKIPAKITGKNTYTKVYGSNAFYMDSKLSTSGKLTYSSSNKSVAKVSSTGKVTIVGPGTAKITVKYAGNSTYSAVTKTVTVKVTPKQVTGTYGKVKSKTSLTYKWKMHPEHMNIIGYQLQYSTDKNFKASSTTTKYLSNINICSTQINVKNSKTYYVRVRAYTKTGGTFLGGKWSEVDTVRINEDGIFSVLSCKTEVL